MRHLFTLRLLSQLSIYVAWCCNKIAAGTSVGSNQCMTTNRFAWVPQQCRIPAVPRNSADSSGSSSSRRGEAFGRVKRSSAIASQSTKGRAPKRVTYLAARRGSDLDSEEDPPSFAVTREEAIVGGLGALLGAAYVGAKGNQELYRSRKRELFKSITSDGEKFRNILEVGVGGNPKVGGFSNLQYYRRGQQIVGLDPALSDEDNSSALEKATRRAQKLGLSLTGVGGVAEKLPFESGSFDAVVSTLVFCSVRDPATALREVSRVLRPGGKFLFVEHIHAPEEGLSILGLRQQQDLLDPLQQQLADGCHLTRQTDQLIKESSTPGGASSSRLFSRVESIENIRVKSMWPVSEQVLGVVVK